MFPAKQRLQAALEQRRQQRRCERCGMLYACAQEECPYCAGLDDLEVSVQLKQRKRFRVGVGTMFLYAAVALALLVVGVGFFI